MSPISMWDLINYLWSFVNNKVTVINHVLQFFYQTLQTIKMKLEQLFNSDKFSKSQFQSVLIFFKFAQPGLLLYLDPILLCSRAIMPQGSGRGLLLYKRLVGMCRWVGPHFQ